MYKLRKHSVDWILWNKGLVQRISNAEFIKPRKKH